MNPITDVEILEAARSLYHNRYYGSDYKIYCEECRTEAATHLMECRLVCLRCAQELLVYGALHND